MFVRIAWKTTASPVALPRDLRRIAPQPRRNYDDLGVPAADFAGMTKGLFDRHE